MRAETTGELERIEEAEEDDEGWDLQKVRAKLEHDTCHTRRREIGLPIKGPVAPAMQTYRICRLPRSLDEVRPRARGRDRVRRCPHFWGD